MQCPHCNKIMDQITADSYICKFDSDHLSYYSPKEFYLYVNKPYKIKIGMSNGPIYYFYITEYSIQFIPAFEFPNILSILNRILKLNAFL